MDPFEKFKSRRAPGANTIADFLVPTTKKPAPKPNSITPKEALQLGNYAQRQVEGVVTAVVKEGEQYLHPFPPGGGPPGAGLPQKKVLEDLGGLLAPKALFKALTELGEGNLPLVKPVTGVGFGLGVGEEALIRERDDRLRAERAAALARLFPVQGATRPVTVAAVTLGRAVLNGSIQPENIQPIAAAALANQAAAEGIRRALVHERADP